MAWSYDPKDASNALPASQYNATLSTCEEQVSKGGNPMLKLSYTVYPPQGGERTVYDYIVNPAGIWKLKKLAGALGQGGAFMAGNFDPARHLGANLDLVLEVEDDAQYGEKNVIRGYAPSTISGQRQAAAPARAGKTTMPADSSINEDDIPF
jgi:hypothetical protein